MNRTEVSDNNTDFWNELCGTSLAKHLGMYDAPQGSLRKFNDWCLDFDPFLFDRIPFDAFKGPNILEIGLEYGSASQKLVEFGSVYTGPSVAAGGFRGLVSGFGDRKPDAYDANSDDGGAPQTNWFFEVSLKHFCTIFTSIEAMIQNIAQDVLCGSWSRDCWLGHTCHSCEVVFHERSNSL
jgi:hypothetical protein